jgi:hypothetical protein
MSDDFNMSMRKFLKQVGVTSQQAIEEAMRGAPEPEKTHKIRAIIEIETLGMRHEVDGEIKGPK